jgi:hypothetical protein
MDEFEGRGVVLEQVGHGASKLLTKPKAKDQGSEKEYEWSATNMFWACAKCSLLRAFVLSKKVWSGREGGALIKVSFHMLRASPSPHLQTLPFSLNLSLKQNSLN